MLSLEISLPVSLKVKQNRFYIFYSIQLQEYVSLIEKKKTEDHSDAQKGGSDNSTPNTKCNVNSGNINLTCIWPWKLQDTYYD